MSPARHRSPFIAYNSLKHIAIAMAWTMVIVLAIAIYVSDSVQYQDQTPSVQQNISNERVTLSPSESEAKITALSEWNNLPKALSAQEKAAKAKALENLGI